MGDVIYPLSSGAMFPDRVAVDFFDPADRRDEKMIVIVTLQSLAGRPALTGVTIRPIHPELVRVLTPVEVHAIPVAELRDRAIDIVLAWAADSSTGPGRGDPDKEVERERQTRGRRLMTDDLLREVAEIVKKDITGRPWRAVMLHFHTSKRSAFRWIEKAREQFPELFDNEED